MVAALNVRRRHHLQLKVRGAAVRGRGTICRGRDGRTSGRAPFGPGRQEWSRGGSGGKLRSSGQRACVRGS